MLRRNPGLFTAVILFIAANGLKASEWFFEEGKGSVAKDSSGLGNNGQIRGATWVSAGKFGGGLAFDGNGQYVDCGNDSSLDLRTGAFGAWLKVDPRPSDGDHPMNAFAKATQYWIHLPTDDSIQAKIRVEGKIYIATTAAGFVRPNRWYHVFGTYDGSALRLFVDGREMQTLDIRGEIDTSSNPLLLGGYAPGLDFFHGTLDDVIVTPKVFTRNEVRDLARRGLDPTEPSASFEIGTHRPVPPATIEFDASQSSVEEGRIVLFEWDFGDGGSATGKRVKHTFRTGGRHVVALTATTKLGKKSTTTRSVQLLPEWVVYPEQEWLRITPEQAGIDVEKFRELVGRAMIHGSTWGGVPVAREEWGAMLTRGGYVFHTWGDPNYKCQSASLGKNFTWLVVSLAVEDGLISADDLIWKTWTGEGELSHPHKYLDRGHHRTLTWRHLFEHRGSFILEGGDWWRKKNGYHSNIPKWAKWTGDPLFDNYAHIKPGTVRHYSSGGYWRLGQALTALWKRDLKKLLDERIFRHMGIPPDRWDWLPGKAVHDDKGFYPEIPFYGEYLGPPYEIDGIVVRGGPGWVVMSPSDLARFGLLIASKGWWKGKRLVLPDYLPNLQYGVGIHAFAGDPGTMVSFAKLNTANFPFGGKVIVPNDLIAGPVKVRRLTGCD